MVAEVVEKLVPIRCIGTTRDGRACNKILLEVEPEHLESVRACIQIKCHHCGTLQ